MHRKNDSSNMLGIIGLLGLVIVGVFGLAALGRDLEQVTYFIGPTVVLLGGILATLFRLDSLGKETEAQTETIKNIDTNVNGRLDAKFRAVHERLDGLTGTGEVKSDSEMGIK